MRKPKHGGTRAGAGRPRDPAALRRGHKLALWVTEELWARLGRAAEKRETTIAAHVRDVLSDAIARGI